MYQHAFFSLVQFRDLLAEWVGDEGGAVEGDGVAILFLATDAVGGDQRHQVGAGVALLHALPVVARADARVVRLAADGGRVEQQLGTEQRHAARGLGEPLVPADAHADLGVAGIPDLEAGIAWVEVVLLVVAGAIRDVALAVHADVAAVGVEDGDAVEAGTAGTLVEADRQHHLQFAGDFLEVRDGRVLGGRGGQLQVVRVGLLAEVGGLEQLLDQDDLRALGGRGAHQLLGLGDIGGAIPGAGHLGGGDGNDTRHGTPRRSRAGHRTLGGAAGAANARFISDKYRL